MEPAAMNANFRVSVTGELSACFHVCDALVDAACNAPLMQVERERQPANAAADDCNVRRCFFHSFCPGRWTLRPAGQHPAGRAPPTIDATIELAFRFQAPADSRRTEEGGIEVAIITA